MAGGFSRGFSAGFSGGSGPWQITVSGMCSALQSCCTSFLKKCCCKCNQCHALPTVSASITISNDTCTSGGGHNGTYGPSSPYSITGGWRIDWTGHGSDSNYISAGLSCSNGTYSFSVSCYDWTTPAMASVSGTVTPTVTITSGAVSCSGTISLTGRDWITGNLDTCTVDYSIS